MQAQYARVIGIYGTLYIPGMYSYDRRNLGWYKHLNSTSRVRVCMFGVYVLVCLFIWLCVVIATGHRLSVASNPARRKLNKGKV